MIKNTKSVGTSTSSIAPSSITSSPTLGMSSLSKKITNSTDTRPIGFETFYPGSFSCTEVGATGLIESAPSSVISQRDSQEPPSYSILDEKSYLPLYLRPGCTKESSILLNPIDDLCTNTLPEFARTPLAPSCNEINNKIALTLSARKDIVNLISQMERSVDWKTEIEKQKFSNAQQKLKESLLAAQSRLTEEEKEEFINEAKRIVAIRNGTFLEKLQDEKKKSVIEANEKFNQDKGDLNECYCDVWSILFKGIQLIIGILIYGENKKLGKDNQISTHLLILLCFVTGMFTSCFLILYLFGRKPSRSMLLYERVYCILCVLAYIFSSMFQLARSTYIMFCCLGMTIICVMDFLRIMFLYEWKSQIKAEDNQTTLKLSENVQSSSRKKNCHSLKLNYPASYGSVSGNELVKKRVTIVTSCTLTNDNPQYETALDLDFLDENLEESINLQNQEEKENDDFFEISQSNDCESRIINCENAKDNEPEVCDSNNDNINNDDYGTIDSCVSSNVSDNDGCDYGGEDATCCD